MSEVNTPFYHQPRAVWATAFACVVGFMSIGLVDPILTSIAAGLNASASQVSLLFTSYFLVTSLMMLVTGYVSSRLGGRKTLLLGAALIVVFSALAGTSTSVAELVGFRAGWGLGNAFFVVTALSVIVGASRGGSMAAILMYESALGLGISAGPLLGAALGAYSWRYPFFGTATLMTIGFLAIWLWLPDQPRPAQKTSLSAPLKALTHGGLLTVSGSAFFYYFAFFTILAFAPFVLQMSAHSVGLIFFGWGILLALFSVLVAPRLQARFSALHILTGCLSLLALILVAMAFGSVTVIATCVVLSGAVMGVCNTIYTEIALEISDAPRPVASAGYNFIRWFAGVAAPFLAPLLAEYFGAYLAFVIAAGAAVSAFVILWVYRQHLLRPEQPVSATAGNATVEGSTRPLLLALSGHQPAHSVLQQTIDMARLQRRPVELVHIRTWEVVETEAIDVESQERVCKLIDDASRILTQAGVNVRVSLLEAPANLLVETMLKLMSELNVSGVILGRHDPAARNHLWHGSLVDALNQKAGTDVELLVVPATLPQS
ncbi:MFS transporter [Gynuella sp.]|uniref:MFS transporter n=1 Tax=Gynuella sp. TaxID=2969146 RepID=UPI003D09BD91